VKTGLMSGGQTVSRVLCARLETSAVAATPTLGRLASCGPPFFGAFQP
jgi:hypothetical protein